MIMPHWPLYFGQRHFYTNENKTVVDILSFFDNPQNTLQNVFHITGTNGKGSTSATIASILQSAGYKVGLYISPHIHQCNERISINGKNISDADLFNIIEEIRCVCEINGFDPTIFQVTTIAMILYFSRNNNDYNVIEVGMGGLHDATNVFTEISPLVSIVTPIHIDHAEYLGKSIVDIAFQKSFIIKPLSTCICAPQGDAVIELISLRCKAVNTELFVMGKDFDCALIEQDNEYFIIEFYCDNILNASEIFVPRPKLNGNHQLVNTTLAVAACCIR